MRSATPAAAPSGRIPRCGWPWKSASAPRASCQTGSRLPRSRERMASDRLAGTGDRHRRGPTTGPHDVGRVDGPGPGIEPGTRGFSGLVRTWPRPRNPGGRAVQSSRCSRVEAATRGQRDVARDGGAPSPLATGAMLRSRLVATCQIEFDAGGGTCTRPMTRRCRKECHVASAARLSSAACLRYSEGAAVHLNRRSGGSAREICSRAHMAHLS